MTEFPFCINADETCGDLESTIAWLRNSKATLLEQLQNHGVVLLRGFPLHDANAFDACVSAIDLQNFSYAESLSNAVRHNRTERVFTANEAPADVEIFLHHEMAQTPIYPSTLFFFCEQASAGGGATLLCQSDRLISLLEAEASDFVADLESKGVRYTNIMPAAADLDSGQGRSWQDTLGVSNKEAAEARLRKLGYCWEWQKGQSLKVTTPVLPAVRKLGNGSKSFFNQLIAAYKGWKDSRNDGRKVIQFGDDTAIADELMERVCSLAEDITFDHYWENGDLAIVDNFQIMHGRRPYQGQRKILASLAQ
ncbi:MAG: SyrP protein [Pseudomonadales bacterium]|nr:SyrP protein [Pseudomonadales bacterium]